MSTQRQVRRGSEVQSISHITCTHVRTLSFTYYDPPLIQWIIARINGRKKTKHDFQVRLGEVMLRLGGEVHLNEEVRLGKAPLRQSGSESS